MTEREQMIADARKFLHRGKCALAFDDFAVREMAEFAQLELDRSPWVAVETAPEKEGWYLISHGGARTYNGPQVSIALYLITGWSGYTGFAPNAWMPLPPPYPSDAGKDYSVGFEDDCYPSDAAGGG